MAIVHRPNRSAVDCVPVRAWVLPLRRSIMRRGVGERRRGVPRRGVVSAVAVSAVTVLALAACSGGPTPAPVRSPGTPDHPRDVIIAAKDYTYIPAVVDLVPGETVTFQVINGGLITHEVVLGGMPIQDAWEAAEDVTSNLPPGQTPAVSVAPDVGGLRFVIRSGERVDVTWTIPADAAAEAGGWFIGCHIPGHWEAGMVVPVRFVGPDGRPLPTAVPSTSAVPSTPAVPAGS